ncbi:MAG: aminopeptidase N [Actinomycetota bacterium]
MGDDVEERNNLTRDEAGARAALVSDVRYRVTLDLSDGDETFGSEAVIRFRCAEPGVSTFLNLIAREVGSVKLNGTALSDAGAFDGARITLPALAEENEVRILARPAFAHSGVGLHRFRDPVDGRVYTYSDFEPYDAHRVFPCFDQPDIKGVFEFVVVAPEAWVVASNAAPAGEPEPSSDGRRRWTFPPTVPMSTYITAVVAGPYHVVRDRHGELELGLYCRQSLAEHLDPEEFFEITKQGFDFFERVFDYPYAFGKKYDQVMVPEFNSGAMENAGCVTFHESYIFRSKVTDASRERRAETILHEMAHMWFGDLVTMRWWDDLWLNESFATFMSVLAQVRATRFTNGWTTFSNSEKTWAYNQDQLPSTHPIVADMPDTVSIHNNFDGITYAKGASVLRQLVAWVGEEPFLRGIARYFRLHELGNTDLGDFLSALEEVSGRDLHAWAKEWLQTAGVNVLRCSFSIAEDGTFAAFTVEQQAPPEWPSLRQHRVAIGLYDRTPEGLVRRERLELDVAGSSTSVPELIGVRAADLVLVNDDDLAYARIRLDERSLATVVEHLGELADSLARTLCWGACWDMVREAEMAARDFLALVLANIAAEDDVGVVQRVLQQAAFSIDAYGDPDNREAARASLASASLQALERARPGSDHQLAWARVFIGAAGSAEHLGVAHGLLDGSDSFDGLAIDTELRWHIVESLASAGADDAVVDAELERDPTDAGNKHAAAARAARPTSEAKAEAWAVVTGDPDITTATAAAIMRGFARPGQEELLRPYAGRYFDALAPIWRDRNLELALAFARMMYPGLLVDEDVVEMTDRYLDAGTPSGPIGRLLVEGRDGVQRALRARARDRAAAG